MSTSMLTRYHYDRASFALIDEAVREADGYADLIERMELASPFLYRQMKGVPLLRVVSPLLVVVVYVMTWDVTCYALHWSVSAVGLACCAAVFLASYATRYFAAIPVSSFK